MCVCVCVCVCVCSVGQLCLSLCNPMDCSPPGSSVHGILQDRVGCHFLLQGIFLTQGLNSDLLHHRRILYYPSHQGSSRKRGYQLFKRSRFPTSPRAPWYSFPGQALSMGFSRTEWVVISFFRGSSWPRNWTRISCITGEFFTIQATREAPGKEATNSLRDHDSRPAQELLGIPSQVKLPEISLKVN